MNNTEPALRSEDSWNVLRALLRFAVFFFILFCVGFVLLTGVLLYSYFQNPQEPAPWVGQILGFLTTSMGGVWRAIEPLFQLLVILVLIEWFIKRLGTGRLPAEAFTGFEWNTQTLVAVIIIGAFAAAALIGLPGLTALKDLALVVVGFYFGTQRRVLELDTDRGRLRRVIEHENPASPTDGMSTAANKPGGADTTTG